MKKMLIYALALALALSLTACGQPKAEQPTDPASGTSTPEPIATPEPIKDTQPPEETDPQEDGQTLEEISHEELLVVFEQQYEISKEINNSDSEETIQNELEMIRITVECMEKSLPSDYEVQYREWRPSVVQQDTQTIETTQQPQNQQSQGQQGQSSKPQGSQTQQPPQQPPQQQQGDSSGDQGSLEGWESFGEVITDPSQIASGTDDPYSGYGEVSIGYGG